MTLETVGASTAGQHERREHGQRRKNPTHLEPPFARVRFRLGLRWVNRAAWSPT